MDDRTIENPVTGQRAIFLETARESGGARTVADIEALLGLHAYDVNAWRPPIVVTEATTGRGLDELVDALERFREESGLVQPRRRTRASTQLQAIVADRLRERAASRLEGPEMEKLVDRIASRTLDPYTAANDILRDKA